MKNKNFDSSDGKIDTLSSNHWENQGRPMALCYDRFKIFILGAEIPVTPALSQVKRLLFTP